MSKCNTQSALTQSTANDNAAVAPRKTTKRKQNENDIEDETEETSPKEGASNLSPPNTTKTSKKKKTAQGDTADRTKSSDQHRHGTNKGASTKKTKNPSQASNKNQGTMASTPSDNVDEGSADYWKSQFLKLQAQQKANENQPLAESTRADTSTEAIEAIPKPKGEAGSKKNGYVLQEAVGLMDNDELYNNFLAFIRNNQARAGIQLNKTYKFQDLSAVHRLCRLTEKELPYFNEQRFPNFWPVTEALKQSLKNYNKNLIAKKKKAAEKRAEAAKNDDPDVISDSDSHGEKSEDEFDGNGNKDEDEDENEEEEEDEDSV
ncbi:hypothetical protein K435DRAFT_856004 [Dendrothele bispora CBS 962.96]|uniref:Uncharacterized protein n=1 Tax=Dendrothele bispora (strain CBS 962.96) TaxID=1314807 RepID=A0A4S8M9G5_DENBC|nr:hypothetical protein K435DRAFT_856004 [Dendrothele bispora CBS 962.96]